MEETRRGFLKSAIAAGSLIVPFGSKEPEVVEEEKIIEPPVFEDKKTLDLGDYLVIPKSHIKSWNISCHGNDFYNRKFCHISDNILEVKALLDPPVIRSSTNLNGNNVQVILPYGTLEY